MKVLVWFIVLAALVVAFAATHYWSCYDFFGIVKGCTAIQK